MHISRRQSLQSLASLAITSVLPSASEQAAVQSAKPTRLILLGTKGGPPVARSGRSNSANLLLINDVPYLVDCGYGVTRQLIAAGVSPGRTRYIFLTHHHSDHTLEYGTLLYQAWLSPRRPEIRVYGPKGTADMTRTAFDTQKLDISVRIEDEGMKEPRTMVQVDELSREGLVMENRDVRVTCCRVRHPPIRDSFAFRFDAKDRSIVISGDTAYSPELIRLAKDADVLVHEALYLPAVDQIVARAANAPRLRQHIIASHTTTEEVGRVAAEAGVKTLILSHLIPGDEPAVPDESWLEGVRKHYTGHAILGRDLLEI